MTLPWRRLKNRKQVGNSSGSTAMFLIEPPLHRLCGQRVPGLCRCRPGYPRFIQSAAAMNSVIPGPAQNPARMYYKVFPEPVRSPFNATARDAWWVAQSRGMMLRDCGLPRRFAPGYRRFVRAMLPPSCLSRCVFRFRGLIAYGDPEQSGLLRGSTSSPRTKSTACRSS
jgi:hypothetical protein